MHCLKNRFITIAIIFLLTGCMTTRLEQPLTNNTHIGILSNFDSKAEFQLIATTMFQNNAYQHALPNFNPNKVAPNVAVNVLRNKGYKVIAIDSSNAEKEEFVHYDPLLGSRVVKEKYGCLRQLADKYHIDTLLLIEHFPVNFGFEMSNTNYYFDGYGILTRSFLGISKTYLGIGYRLYLIRLQDFTILATQSDSATQQENKDLCKDKFEQIPASDLNYIGQTLKTLLTQSLETTILKALSL